ncbi:MAG: hypothetical protein IH991_05040, partial [Planctomycetes bacterium]|nr:hypothetical protein [Planctomycetota bacterium]
MQADSSQRWSLLVLSVGIVLGFAAANPAHSEDPTAKQCLNELGITKGICVVVDSAADLPVELAKQSDLIIFYQSPNQEAVGAVRRAAHDAGLLGTRVFVDRGNSGAIHLADNLADGLVSHGGDRAPKQEELLRVLHPGAKAMVGEETIVKPRPKGADEWSHPYHGPDNNPQSNDQDAKAPYLTQFLCDPWYVPMPQVTVAS